MDENKRANVWKNIFRNNSLRDSEISVFNHATENVLCIREEGNEESDEKSNPAGALIERLTSDQIMQRSEEIRNPNEPAEDSQEIDKARVFEDRAFAKEHEASMIKMKQ